jgi:uncharacterized protein involved in exopolysaccharide biosynthesis
MPQHEPAPQQTSVDFSAILWYRRVAQRIPFVFMASILGALLGVGLGLITPPSYRATAILTIGVDYSRSQWLDEDADRLVLGRVQELVLSDDVLEAVLERSDAGSGVGQPPDGSIAELRDQLRLLWADNRWELSSRSRDPVQAAATANSWAEVALDQLRTASAHALRAAELQSLFFRVYCRPQSLAGDPDNPLWVCDEGEPSPELSGLPANLIAEIELSRGIVPALSYAWEARASPPSEAEGGGRALMILGGMLAGLLLGTVAVAATRDPSR